MLLIFWGPLCFSFSQQSLTWLLFPDGMPVLTYHSAAVSFSASCTAIFVSWHFNHYCFFFFFWNHLVLIHVIFFTLALSHTPATLNLLCSLFDFSHGNKVLCIQLLYVDFFPLVSKCFFFFFFFLMRPISATSEGLIYPEELNFLPVCDN